MKLAYQTNHIELLASSAEEQIARLQAKASVTFAKNNEGSEQHCNKCREEFYMFVIVDMVTALFITIFAAK